MTDAMSFRCVAGKGNGWAALQIWLIAGHAMIAFGLGSSQQVLAASTVGDNLKAENPNVYVAERLAYDDNLYRIPSLEDVTSRVGPNATRQDRINTVSLGLDGQWPISSQAIVLKLRADDNRFFRNDALNNTSGSGILVWNWKLADKLSGQAGVDYSRSLASFANTLFFARDMVDRTEYLGSARYQVGPHWTLTGGIREADTSNSAAAVQVYNFHSKSGNAGIEYATSAHNTVGWDYSYTDARFFQAAFLSISSFNPNYNEDTTRVLLKYALPSGATVIDASAGYLRRDYPNAAIGAFSGDIWRVSVQWQPTVKTQFVLAGWRELKAYLDSESNYFVSKGGSISPIWVASATLTFSLAASWDDQNYIRSNSSALSLISRHDKVTADQVGIAYTPARSLTFNFSYRYEKRESNRSQFQYNDKLTSASLTFKF
jgi:hypothetical protein